MSLKSGNGDERGWGMRMLLFVISLILLSLLNLTFTGIKKLMQKKNKREIA